MSGFASPDEEGVDVEEFMKELNLSMDIFKKCI